MEENKNKNAKLKKNCLNCCGLVVLLAVTNWVPMLLQLFAENSIRDI